MVDSTVLIAIPVRPLRPPASQEGRFSEGNESERENRIRGKDKGEAEGELEIDAGERKVEDKWEGEKWRGKV